MRRTIGGRFLPFLFLIFLVATLVRCGGGSVRLTTGGDNLTGSVAVHLSDPPTCKGALAPSGLKFNHVWVTITRVRAHQSANANSEAAGWTDLADLRSDPKQIDLLGGATNACTLAQLGSSSGLPAGRYQQIRLHLLSNSPGGSEATPANNQCSSVGGFNCVELADGTRRLLLLSSQVQTGIKVPPGRIAGGGLNLEAGQAADINIDFNACNSVVQLGDGSLRLLPTLHAGEVSLSSQSITGRAVDSTTSQAIAGTIVVLAEQPDEAGIDRIVQQTLADSNQGTFTLCPLPTGNYDIVVAASSSAGVTYNATITFAVPVGTALGDISLVPEPGPDTSPGELEGQVTTATTAGGATGADIAVSPLQEATPAGGSPRWVTIPTFGDSLPNVATETGTCPAGTKCATYRLFVPASNPQVGTFSSSGTSYTAPASGDVLYRINARAFIPGTTDPNCSPSSQTTDKQSDGSTLTVTAGTKTTVQTLVFTGCQAAF